VSPELAIASEGGSNRIELGTDEKAGENPPMIMGDLPIPPNMPWKHAESVNSSEPNNDKGCNSCHDNPAANQPNPGLILSEPIDNFGNFGGPPPLSALIISTNDPGKQACITMGPPAPGQVLCATNTDGSPVTPQSIAQICSCIGDNQKAIVKAAMNPDTPYNGGTLATSPGGKPRGMSLVNPDAERDVGILKMLCTALQNYKP
jgi:hypothetical protein